jgi:hypothetical protein
VLASIAHAAYQLNHSIAQGQNAQRTVAFFKQGGTGAVFQIINGRVNQANVFLGQISEQNQVANTAIAEV